MGYFANLIRWAMFTSGITSLPAPAIIREIGGWII